MKRKKKKCIFLSPFFFFHLYLCVDLFAYQLFSSPTYICLCVCLSVCLSTFFLLLSISLCLMFCLLTCFFVSLYLCVYLLSITFFLFFIYNAVSIFLSINFFLRQPVSVCLSIVLSITFLFFCLYLSCYSSSC